MGNVLRILVVDDHPTLLLTYQWILEANQHAVSVAMTTQAALAQLQGQSFDLLVSDLVLDTGPRAGLDVIECARNRHPGIRCLLLTGNCDSEVLELARQRGITVLHKPVGVKELMEAIQASQNTANAA